MSTCQIKRVYEPAANSDGYRILIDRLWPRGLSKEKAHVDKWLKEVAPSTDLRKWFNHEPEKWASFCTRYRGELRGSAAFAELVNDIHTHKTVTLLFGARDKQHNDAVALEEFIREQGGR
ncbi:MAG TPA: DUF488 domain-containing protein [Puia sp.]|jgi:uncharacterized protein YeaO (DUF488 family)|nr:DUF488 domain-containing protein [Puia sp.]